jgi:hypothetical protein
MQSMPNSPKTIQIFYSYATDTEDEGWQKKLEQQLSALNPNGLVSHWQQGLIGPGEEWQLEIDKHLNMARNCLGPLE